MGRGAVGFHIFSAHVFIRGERRTHKYIGVFYVTAGNIGAETDIGGTDAIAGDILIEIVGIEPDGYSDLFQIAETPGAHRRLFCLVQCRQQHPRQDRDDRNHNEELYQSKATRRFTGMREKRGGILAAKMILITDH